MRNLQSYWEMLLEYAKTAFKKPIGAVAQLVGRRFEKIGWKSSNLFGTTYNVGTTYRHNITILTTSIVCFS